MYCFSEMDFVEETCYLPLVVCAWLFKENLISHVFNILLLILTYSIQHRSILFSASKFLYFLQMKEILGDYDAIHVRRGDLLKNRKDRFGVERSLHPHLDRDTRPEFIKKRVARWIQPGRTLFIASNERTPGFFSPLSDR